MRQLRCLFVVSRDFGEYVTAQLFSRGQPFEAWFALPAPLAAFVDTGRVTAWSDLRQLEAIVGEAQPDVVMLCSGYLFAVNGLVPLPALAHWLASLHARGIALATTDPWLALDDVQPQAPFSVFSVSRGGAVPELSQHMTRLHEQLRRLLRGVAHVYAVPVPASAANAISFYNPRFAGSAAPVEDEAGEGQWLFVLSREDHVFLEGFGGDAFRSGLERHVRRLAAAGQRVVFVGPPALAPFFEAGLGAVPGVAYRAYCTTSAFEREIRASRVVAYWNTLSSSLLYCMYHGVPPVFFDSGHQAKIRAGLYEHAIKWVYGGAAPQLLPWTGMWPAAPDSVVRAYGLDAWLARIAARHAREREPVDVLDTLLSRWRSVEA